MIIIHIYIYIECVVETIHFKIEEELETSAVPY